MAEECDTTKRVIIKHASFPGKRHVRSRKIYFYSFKAYRMETRQGTLPLHQESQQDTGSNC
jgi:hypothetical protein